MPWPLMNRVLEPWAPVTSIAKDADPYRHGDTAAVAIEGLQAVLCGLPKPTVQGNGWAEWKFRDGRVVLQASYIEFARDRLRVSNPRVWILRAGHSPELVEADMRNARNRVPQVATEFVRAAITSAIGA